MMCHEKHNALKGGKNLKTTMTKIIAVLLTLCVCLFTLCSCGGKVEKKNPKTYHDEVNKMEIFDSTVDEELPQTIIYKLITEHFAAPLAEGKTVKKAIFLGYDGFRADGLENIKDMEDSGIMYIKSKGGLYHTFSGGVSGVNEQATSTAPSWMAMLTGGWAAFNGVDDNGKMKNADAKTCLLELAEQGKSASFTTSWREHTALSYRPDTINAIKNGLKMEFTHQPDDAGTYYQVLKYVANPAGVEKTTLDPDVVFLTFEHTDHAGHDTGFGNQKEEYISACKEMDSWGYDIIKTIEARDTYDTEDWLIIISTDHGGTNYGHGGQTPFERMTWLSCNKTIDLTEENLKFARTK